jgi:hypothetical protein
MALPLAAIRLGVLRHFFLQPRGYLVTIWPVHPSPCSSAAGVLVPGCFTCAGMHSALWLVTVVCFPSHVSLVVSALSPVGFAFWI